MTESHQHRLDYMTWADAGDFLAAGGDTAILPVGSTEMHGPHLPLGTDYLIALAVATLAAPASNAVILPPLPYTWAGATRHFAGTISLPADLVLQFVKTICQRLIDQGFRQIALVSQHNPDTTTLGLAAWQLFEETRVPVVAFNPYPTDPHVRAMLPELIGELDQHEATDPGFAETWFLLAALEILNLEHLARVDGLARGQRILLFIRPNDVPLVAGESGENILAGTVRQATYLGDRMDYRVQIADGIEARVQTASGSRYARGDRVHLRLPVGQCRLIREE